MKTTLTIFVSVFLCQVLLSACSNGKLAFQVTQSPDRNNSSTAAVAVKQAPKINCTLRNLSNTSAGTQTVSSIISNDTFFAMPPIEGQTISFDCTQTVSDPPSQPMTYSLDTDYSPTSPQFVPQTSANFNFTSLRPGSYPMAIQVSDGTKTTIKTFTLNIQCQNQIKPVLDTSGVSVTAGNRLNYFTYSIDPSAVTGGNSFMFSWDFNGDYGYDAFSLLSPDVWTSSYSLNSIYTVYATDPNTSHKSRLIGLKIRNDCAVESYYTIDLNFPMANIPRNAQAQATAMPYHYIQADVSGAPATNQRVNGDVLVTWYPDDDIERVVCDYKKTRTASPAVFTISGSNWYFDPSGENEINPGDKHLHGLYLRVNNINDNLSMGLQSFTDANVETAQYTAAGVDGSMLVQETYEKKSGCSVAIRIIRAQAVTPCADDQLEAADFSETAPIQIMGEYSCPTLTYASTGANVAVNNGKFFCEVGPINQCVGGGQGGGGVPPPHQ